MSYFKYEASCSNCEFASLYIPYYTYRYADPYCSKGHGKCDVDKICKDFKRCGSHYCCECKYYNKKYCEHHNKKIKPHDEACVYFKLNDKKGGKTDDTH